MPVYHCCVPGCTSSTRKKLNLTKYPHLHNVKFFSLPKKSNKIKRNKWINMIRRERGWRPNKYTRICSLHFDSGCDTPTLFPYNNFKETSKKRTTCNSSNTDQSVNDRFAPEREHCDISTDTSDDFCIYEDKSIPFIGEIEVSEANSNVLLEGKKFEDTERRPPSSDHSYIATPQCSPPFTDRSVQTELTMNDITKLSEENKNLKAKLADKSSLLRDAFVENITKNDANVRSYTGLPSLALLLGIFNILVSKCSSLKYWSGQESAKEKNYQRNPRREKPGPTRKLSLFQEFILTLVRLRLGIYEFCLADVFGISKSRVSQIFITWITFMSNVFGYLIRWPTRNQVRKYMPMSFRKNYPNTRAVIDCTEFFFQRPRSPTSQAATYSTYKSKNTGKCLLAISPSGTFTFVSKVYGGNVSDRFISLDSGFLDFVEEDDDIMADRGFTIRDLITNKKATLNIPPFTRKCSWGKKKRLNVNEIKQTRKIAKLRIHVERAIQRLKLFRLLGNIIPWSLKPIMNQMIKVAAFLCNLMPPLVRR